ncbi:MAG TPA: extracellular solute-binding protein [Alphaproteobacteria bacterium]|nr:extracellular solute-binding protein [Alphaproteobacteria bacterium]
MTGPHSRKTSRLLTVLLGCITAALIAPAAQAAGKTVYFLSWGGTIQTMLEKEGWADEFKKDTGYEVTLVPKATSAEIIATAIAQKDKPQVDVVMCDHPAWVQGLHQGIFSAVDQEGVPNLADLYPIAPIKEDGKTMGVYAYGDVVGILYQPEVFKKNKWAPPTGWKDLMRPEFKGKLIIPPVSNTFGLYTLIEFAKMGGGGIDKIDPGFAELKALAPNVMDWTTTFAKIGEFFESGAAAIAVFSAGTGLEFKKRGIPVAIVMPDPAYLSPTSIGVMKNAPDPEGARVFMNWLLSPKVLAYRANRFGQIAMNKKVELTGEAAELLPPSSEMGKLAVIDYDAVLALRSAWNERFEKDIAPVK